MADLGQKKVFRPSRKASTSQSKCLMTFLSSCSWSCLLGSWVSEDAMAGWKQEGRRKPHEGHPSQKKWFWTPPLVQYVLHPLKCLCSVFPVQKSKTQSTRGSLGEGSEHFLEGALSGALSSPIRFATPPLYHGQRFFVPRDSEAPPFPSPTVSLWVLSRDMFRRPKRGI